MMLTAVFFFSSRRRHTRCALVTGFRRVLFRSKDEPDDDGEAQHRQGVGAEREPGDVGAAEARLLARGRRGAEQPGAPAGRGYVFRVAAHRSEGRGVGKEWVSTCRSRWSPDHTKTNRQNKRTQI